MRSFVFSGIEYEREDTQNCPTTNPCGKRDYCIDTINNNIDDPWQGQCDFWWEG
ncbi:unnamed protein product, partial [Rotaria magnacalcarata]